jgi:hypothetical protein
LVLVALLALVVLIQFFLVLLLRVAELAAAEILVELLVVPVVVLVLQAQTNLEALEILLHKPQVKVIQAVILRELTLLMVAVVVAGLEQLDQMALPQLAVMVELEQQAL